MKNQKMEHCYLSPHLSDVVYSCGGIIDRQIQNGDEVTVITVFAGIPSKDLLLPAKSAVSPEQLARALFPRCGSWWKQVVTPISMDQKQRVIACYSQEDKKNFVSNKGKISAASISGNENPVERLWQPIELPTVSNLQCSEIIVCPKCRSSMQPGKTKWRFGQTGLNFRRDTYAYELSSTIVRKYGLSRRSLFVAEKRGN